MLRSRLRDASRDWLNWALCLLAEFPAVGCSVGVSVVGDAADTVPIGIRYKNMSW
jgi:hypothetical protein